MLYDTDALIWFKRGNGAVADIMEQDPFRYLSLQTYLELVQGARDRRQLLFARRFLAEFHFETLPLTETIGNRAAQLVESYALSHGMRAGDALIAATALEHNLPLCTANVRHFRQIPSLAIIDFPVLSCSNSHFEGEAPLRVRGGRAVRAPAAEAPPVAFSPRPCGAPPSRRGASMGTLVGQRSYSTALPRKPK